MSELPPAAGSTMSELATATCSTVSDLPTSAGATVDEPPTITISTTTKLPTPDTPQKRKLASANPTITAPDAKRANRNDDTGPDEDELHDPHLGNCHSCQNCSCYDQDTKELKVEEGLECENLCLDHRPEEKELNNPEDHLWVDEKVKALGYSS